MGAGTANVDIYLLLALRGTRVRPLQTVFIALSVACTVLAAVMVFGYMGAVTEVTAARVPGEPAGQLVARSACQTALGAWTRVLLLLPALGATATTCLLTASLLGRKRCLGVMRAEGGTTRELGRLLLFEALAAGVPGIPLGLGTGEVSSKLVWGIWVASAPALLASTGIALATVLLGMLLPLLLLKSATTDQLLMNKPVYVISNPSCAKCGACGGL